MFTLSCFAQFDTKTLVWDIAAAMEHSLLLADMGDDEQPQVFFCGRNKSDTQVVVTSKIKTLPVKCNFMEKVCNLYFEFILSIRNVLRVCY